MYKSATLASIVGLAQLAKAGLYPGITPDNHTCILDKPLLSCSKDAVPSKVDTCCVETFGGLVLQTQFWSIYTGLEDKGQVLPKDSWSIHGLWPDFCNGSYTGYCDLSRQYDPDPSPNTTNGKPDGTPIPPYKGTPLPELFEPYGKGDLLAYMNKYWINQGQPNWWFWGHEFSKHATCYSSFQKECFGPKATKYGDLFEFYETVIAYFKTLPTWDWLSKANIHPSNTTSYTYGHIQAAIEKGYGKPAYLGCTGPAYNETKAGKGSKDNGATQLSEIWYYNHVLGRPQDLHPQRVRADIKGEELSNCAKAPGAIWYYERAKGSEA